MDVGSLSKDEIVICVQCLNNGNIWNFCFFPLSRKTTKTRKRNKVVIFSPKGYGWWQGRIKGKEERAKENLILFCSPYILGFFRFKGKLSECA